MGLNRLGWARAGPVNTYFVPREHAQSALAEGLRQALSAAGGEPEQLGVVVVGAPSPATVIESAVRSVSASTLVLGVGEDPISVYGTELGERSILVIAGTGSRATLFLDGEAVGGAGGWGASLGDEGSGYAIGLAALRAVIAEAEGRGERTALTASLFRHWRLSELREIIPIVYGDADRRRAVADLCPLVAAIATEGDSVARHILTRAGSDLADLAWSAWLSRYDPVPSSLPVQLVPVGGVFGIGSFILERLLDGLKTRLTSLQLRRARWQPAIGALAMALMAAGHPLDQSALAGLDLANDAGRR